MRFSVPHPIPYQGSKRRFATAILSHVEAAKWKKFRHFKIGDRLEPLVRLWQAIIDDPESIASEYERLWEKERKRPIDEFYYVRSKFNEDRDPAKLLYLLARCVKNAVRFNPSGEFNQSPDKRRTGTRPDAMRRELFDAHRLLHGKAQTVCADFLEEFKAAEPGDFFYLDPPYQGTSEGRDSRYIGGVTREKMIEGLNLLNEHEIPFILSYDGSCGDRTYGDRLPREIASRILLDVGRSSQATLNGQDHVTIESLYVSHGVIPATADDRMMDLRQFDEQLSMTQLLI